ncbi:carbohydrate porin [Tropicimonas marinistellae]|uniref:carbohydrate porin n=1 Tax=Tropicimonas marinistellae TaxID=1739787 RepID=UPI0008345798|nr:carbohydrate porin [Tropicimonas marinistellae]
MKPVVLAYCAIFLVAALSSGPATAQSGDLKPSGPQSNGTKAGYSQAGVLEGPSGVLNELAQDDSVRAGLLSPRGTLAFFDPWYAWKKRLNANVGLQLGFSFQTLYQSADETLTGISEAAATRGQIQGAWTFLNRGGTNTGKLTFRVRNRQAWDQNLPPSQLAYQFGSIVNSGTGFGASGWELNELAWRQSMFDDKFRFVVGNISAISWYNNTALSSSLTGFQNTAMQSSLAKPGPGRGLGFGVGFEVTPKVAMVASVHDANSTASQNPLETIEQQEYFYSTELRYLPSGIREQMWNSFRLQVWYQDALEEKGLKASSGVAIQAGYLFDDTWYPFALGGWSDGNASIFREDFVAGLGVKIHTRNRPSDDMFGIAAGWGNPSVDALQDQYTAEAFYRLQLLASFAITPSVQIVRHPAANPDTDQVVLWGLRTRIQF